MTKETLYQKQILALAKSQTGAGEIAGANRRARLHNPLCGDEILLTARITNGGIAALAHKTRGCVLCLAAAARVCEIAKANSQTEYLASLAQAIEEMFVAAGAEVAEAKMFAPAIAHISRRECVLLPFRALRQICEEEV